MFFFIWIVQSSYKKTKWKKKKKNRMYKKYSKVPGWSYAFFLIGTSKDLLIWIEMNDKSLKMFFFSILICRFSNHHCTRISSQISRIPSSWKWRITTYHRTSLKYDCCQKRTRDSQLQSHRGSQSHYWMVSGRSACKNSPWRSRIPSDTVTGWIFVFSKSYAIQKRARWWSLLVCGFERSGRGKKQQCHSWNCL